MPGKGSGSREVRPHFTEQRNYTNTIPASAEKSSGANSWLRNLGYAAAAIIAALSVESGRDGNIREDLPLRLRARIADAIHCLRRRLQSQITSQHHRFLRLPESWRRDRRPSRAETKRRDQESACRRGLGSLPV